MRRSLGIFAMVFVFAFSGSNLFAQTESEKNLSLLTGQEQQSIAQAGNPESRMKVFVNIANERLKSLLGAADKQDLESAQKIVPAFRVAISGADDALTQILATNKNPKKSLNFLFKATRDQVSLLIRKIGKASGDLQPSLQSALEAVQRIQGGLMMQMEKHGMTP